MLASGACGLLYQSAWLRDLRSVFGASTPATATVLALFMGGLGLGAAWLGPRVDRSPRPLHFYGRLELGIAICAAASPPLALLVRSIYFAMGGAWTLGPIVGTLVRVLLSAIVLGVPAVLMGGTLPAMVRAAALRGESGHRSLAVLYGLNTLGAVTGVLLATFVTLERLGTPGTVWAAAAANVLVALIALSWSKRVERARPDLVVVSATNEPSAAGSKARRTPHFVVAAAAVTGFVFFLMEMIWYRMLAPLLGGTTFSFGVILAVALLGIGLGGIAHGAIGARRRATARQFAVTCGLEALVLAIPFALGDRIAILTALLNPIGRFDFPASVAVWSLIAGIVVFPAALVAGYQFPLLVRLLGEEDRTLGGDTGRAYAWNTLGAIAGSLAGGFVLIPWLSALGSWRLSVLLMSALCLATIVAAVRPFRISRGSMPFQHSGIRSLEFT